MDPTRLLHENLDELERELLRSAQRDASPPGAKERVAGVLGLGVVAGLAGLAASGTASASVSSGLLLDVGACGTGGTVAGVGALGAGPSTGGGLSGVAGVAAGSAGVAVGGKAIGVGAATGGAMGLLSVIKSAAGGMALGLLVSGAATQWTSEAPVSDGEQPTLDTVLAAPPSRPPRPRLETVAPVVASAPKAPEVSRVVVAPSPKAPLAEEVASLDEVRRRLAAGEAKAALALLERHSRAFPSGALAMETAILRARALEASGDTAAAALEAQRILAESPGSRYERLLQPIAASVPSGASGAVPSGASGSVPSGASRSVPSGSVPSGASGSVPSGAVPSLAVPVPSVSSPPPKAEERIPSSAAFEAAP